MHNKIKTVFTISQRWCDYYFASVLSPAHHKLRETSANRHQISLSSTCQQCIQALLDIVLADF